MDTRDTVLMLALVAGALFFATQAGATIAEFVDENGNPVDANGNPIVTNDSGDTTVAPVVEDVYWKTNDYPLYAGLITQVEQLQGIPTDLLGRLLYQESSYLTAIITGAQRSPVGALGIAQFMPATAISLGINPLNPQEAIPAAGKYLVSLFNSLGQWSYALGAYNWGIGNFRKYLAGKATIPQETQNYIAQIIADVPVA